MIDREGGLVVLHCDTCTEFLETGEEEFVPAWEIAMKAGWQARRVGPEWVHACPDCSREPRGVPRYARSSR